MNRTVSFDVICGGDRSGEIKMGPLSETEPFRTKSRYGFTHYCESADPSNILLGATTMLRLVYQLERSVVHQLVVEYQNIAQTVPLVWFFHESVHRNTRTWWHTARVQPAWENIEQQFTLWPLHLCEMV